MHNGPNKNKNDYTPEYRHTAFSKFIGTTLGAIGEQVLFHPIDTTAKTAMANSQPVLPWLRTLLVKNGVINTSSQLYRGFTLGVAKKAPLRVYKYWVQDEIATQFKMEYSDSASATFGPYGHVVLQAAAGAVTGAFEPVLFQWIDTMQVRKQVLGEPISLSSAQKLGLTGLYRGTLVTGLGRNMFGAAGLFGGSELANQVMDNQDHRSDAKNLLAKWGGAFMSLMFSQPGDVIKTKMQVKQIPLLQAVGGISLKQLFTSGLAPRLVMSGKVGAGFLLIEKSMHLAKDWFGEEVPKEEDAALFETRPTLLTKFDQKASDCSATDESSTQENDSDKELVEKFKKVKI